MKMPGHRSGFHISDILNLNGTTDPKLGNGDELQTHNSMIGTAPLSNSNTSHPLMMPLVPGDVSQYAQYPGYPLMMNDATAAAHYPSHMFPTNPKYYHQSEDQYNSKLISILFALFFFWQIK